MREGFLVSERTRGRVGLVKRRGLRREEGLEREEEEERVERLEEAAIDESEEKRVRGKVKKRFLGTRKTRMPKLRSRFRSYFRVAQYQPCFIYLLFIYLNK